MSKKSIYRPVLGPKALEMVMRDVLSGMEEMAIMDSFDTSHLFEVVSIECSDIEPENDVRWQQTESTKNRDSRVHGKIIALDQFRPVKTLLNE